MKYGIIYSIYTDEDDIKNNLQFKELQYSLATLRQHNTTIDVKVYIDCKNNIPDLSNYNCEVIRFKVNPDPRLFDYEKACWLDHKWKSAFHALETYNYDAIFMIDADTIYFKNPEDLFTIYSEKDIYCQEDIWIDLFKILNIKYRAMNDGVVLIKKNVLNKKEKILKARNQYMVDCQQNFKDKLDHNDKLWSNGMLWACPQYGISEMLGSEGNPIEFYSNSHVSFSFAFDNKLTKNERKEVYILHYSSYHVEDWLPNSYWNGTVLKNHMKEKGI